MALRDWLPEIIQQVQPWISSEDIDKGQRWAIEVGAKLGEMSQGLICVTPDNLREPWLNFEAGALAKSIDDSRVRPVLLGVQPSELTGPLALFQATVATDREDMFRLVASLNAACSAPLDTGRLERAFERNWDDYLRKLSAVEEAELGQPEVSAKRSQEDMIGEILERLREVQRSVESARNVEGELRPQEILLADGTPVRTGMRVFVPGWGIGRVARAISVATFGAPNEGMLTLYLHNGEVLERVRASDLRRPTPEEHAVAGTIPLQDVGTANG
ncbi:hypothetical protein VAB18032_01275 [Micromonospora maris AB-18-032]|uniref:TIR domain-containing protein n=2 Tax=Micromonospora maris TaxID=1003110 RepID=A0A9X0I413_9ACTN|nr:hypothetical protein VAB18032_01275 [Micromonospora maris AB-18-032]KUJ46428.1 hypothetical protein ADL17_26295 [Micromonospora maris]